jgi:hypothetical protein
MMDRVINAAFALGANVTRQTPTSDVGDLVNRLHPIESGRPLIRIGSESDGGYLLPDDLEGIEYCFSPGVGATSSFEGHLATRNIRSFLADYSVASPPLERAEFTFDKKFLGACDSDTSFTLDSWKMKYLPNYRDNLLLQMDIEGSEYESILSATPQTLKLFRIMIIEFHHLEKIFDPFVHALYRACFDKILRYFSVVHIHPNNCCGSVNKNGIEVPRVMEFTFYSNSRITGRKRREDFPHPLDRDNVPDRRSLPLPRCWYGMQSAH